MHYLRYAKRIDEWMELLMAAVRNSQVVLPSHRCWLFAVAEARNPVALFEAQPKAAPAAALLAN